MLCLTANLSTDTVFYFKIKQMLNYDFVIKYVYSKIKD